MDEDSFKRADERFQDHLRNTFKLCRVDDRALNLASAIVLRRALRASDAIQLAACLILSGEARERLTFVCADRRLLTAAQTEGLTVLNPDES